MKPTGAGCLAHPGLSWFINVVIDC